jgi:hypothetical protein
LRSVSCAAENSKVEAKFFFSTYIRGSVIPAGRRGTDVMIFKIFSPKKIAKKLEFLTQNKATYVNYAKFWS